MTRLIAPLAQVALLRGRSNVVDMPPSTYRPSPPSSRARNMPAHALEPGRQLIEGYAPPKHEATLRSAPEPPKEPSEVAGKKKKRAKSTPEVRATALNRVSKLIADGTPSSEAFAAVAKEIGVSSSAVYQWRVAAKNGAGSVSAVPAPKLTDLDLILDIIELCERAKKGLTKSQRMRLRAALNERLS